MIRQGECDHMVQSMEAAQSLPLECRRSFSQIIGDIGTGKLTLIALCALVGTVAGNAIYDFATDARATYTFMEKTRPSESYLKAMRSPPIDYARVEQAPFDFYDAYEVSMPMALTKGDQCWNTYDAAPSWSQFEYCVAFDTVLRNYASPQEIKGHAQKSGYPSAIDRKTVNFLVGASADLKGEHVAIQRANDVLMAVRIDNR